MNDVNIDDIYIKMIRKKSGADRILMCFSMFDFVSKILLSSINEKYGNLKNNRKELYKLVFLRLYGNDFDKQQKEKIINLMGSIR